MFIKIKNVLLINYLIHSDLREIHNKCYKL